MHLYIIGTHIVILTLSNQMLAYLFKLILTFVILDQTHNF